MFFCLKTCVCRKKVVILREKSQKAQKWYQRNRHLIKFMTWQQC